MYRSQVHNPKDIQSQQITLDKKPKDQTGNERMGNMLETMGAESAGTLLRPLLQRYRPTLLAYLQLQPRFPKESRRGSPQASRPTSPSNDRSSLQSRLATFCLIPPQNLDFPQGLLLRRYSNFLQTRYSSRFKTPLATVRM